jgi:CHAT domain-containing protein
VGLEGVASSLPEDTALVAFARYARHPLPGDGTGGGSAGAATPADHYLALVLRGAGSDPVLVPLGKAGSLDAAIAAWRDAVFAARGDASYRSAATMLRDRLWKPIVPAIAGMERVFLVPDGDISLVSFAALPGATQRYLIEEGPVIHYLSTERDLVIPPVASDRGGGLLALGDPAFNARSPFRKLTTQDAPLEEKPAPAPSTFRGGTSHCGDFRDLYFPPVAVSAREVATIADLWSDMPDGTATGTARVLTGEDATETALKSEVAGHRVLHLATHGFYLGGACPSALGTRGIGGLAGTGAGPPPRLLGENPLLLSGLAFAGANHRDAAAPDEDDGILTAEEIASLDLHDLAWAVLSACETGLGTVVTGEGVLGMRRAFRIAGAGTVIMSLWPVEEESTRAWMTELYRARMQRQLDTASAMREASLRVLEQRRAAGLPDEPFFWAAFVASGGWE